MDTEPIPETVAECVQAGVDILNEEFPGWLKKINTDILDIEGIDTCVLGQLSFNGYVEYVSRLYKGNVDGSSWPVRWMARHGFTISYTTHTGAALTQGWKDAIVALRG